MGSYRAKAFCILYSLLHSEFGIAARRKSLLTFFEVRARIRGITLRRLPQKESHVDCYPRNGGDRIAITRDGSGIFPLDRSSVAGCQFFSFHGVSPT